MEHSLHLGFGEHFGGPARVALTTTTDTRAHVEKSPKAIGLAGGPEIAALLVACGVGGSLSHAIVLPEIDEDSFEDG